ncbi:MAG: hypothetical protein ACREBE_25700 [bacterium]
MVMHPPLMSASALARRTAGRFVSRSRRSSQPVLVRANILSVSFFTESAFAESVRCCALRKSFHGLPVMLFESTEQITLRSTMSFTRSAGMGTSCTSGC